MDTWYSIQTASDQLMPQDNACPDAIAYAAVTRQARLACNENP